jgi:membrane-associated phospholipid phosphatase
MSKLRVFGIAFALGSLGILVSIKFVDQPVARFFYKALGHLFVFDQLSGTPSLFGPITIGIAVIFVLRRAACYSVDYFDGALIQGEISLLATKLLLSPLKALFGRNWPLYGDPSFLLNGAYGFHFFSGDSQHASFPSGHAASVSAMCVVLWRAYPEYRTLYATGAAAVSAALVAGNFHFVSDVIGGLLLGGLVAGPVVLMWAAYSGSRFRRRVAQ